MLRRLPKPVKLSHERVLKMFKYQEPEFYTRLFYESEKGLFEVPTDCTNKDEIGKLVPGAPELYVFKKINSVCIFCSLSSEFFFIGDRVSADQFKYAISPLLKVNESLKFAQYVAMNNLKEKGKKW